MYVCARMCVCVCIIVTLVLTVVLNTQLFKAVALSSSCDSVT
jgi:hypothetical protein